MGRQKPKTQIITFKADAVLLSAMGKIPNRSEFIRDAVSAALDSVCPLCNGGGILSPAQKTHWQAFTADHEVTECAECHEDHLVCRSTPKEHVHRKLRRAVPPRRPR